MVSTSAPACSPSVMGCDLEVEAVMNPFFSELLLVLVFVYHRNGKPTGGVTFSSIILPFHNIIVGETMYPVPSNKEILQATVGSVAASFRHW